MEEEDNNQINEIFEIHPAFTLSVELPFVVITHHCPQSYANNHVHSFTISGVLCTII